MLSRISGVAAENYLYPTVTLLMIVCLLSRTLALLAMAITATWLTNMMLHDVLFPPEEWIPVQILPNLRLVNTALNALVFVAWTYAFVYSTNANLRLTQRQWLTFYCIMALLTLVFQVWIRSYECSGILNCGVNLAKSIPWSVVWPASWVVYLAGL